MELHEKIAHALERTGHPADSTRTARLLSQGAWHAAYLLTLPNDRQLVVRLPLDVSYGKPFAYDEATLRIFRPCGTRRAIAATGTTCTARRSR